MRKSNLIQKLLLLTLVGLMIVGTAVGVLGAKTEKIRPISEFGENNPNVGINFVGNRMFASNDWYGDFADPATTYDGLILEKENSDGSLDVTVDLYIHNLLVGVFEFRNGPPPALIFLGFAEVHLYVKFTVDNGSYADILPNIDYLFYGIGGSLKAWHFIAYGSGDYYEDGTSVPAKLIAKGMALFKPQLPEDHPLRGVEPYIWPGEFIIIHTI